MKICIIGGGNVGTALAVMASSFGQAEVVMLTSAPGRWRQDITLIDSISGERTQGRLAYATSDCAQAVNGCDMVLVAQPSFLVANTLKTLAIHLKAPAMIGIIPGTGGAEYMARELLRNGHTLFGVDRVPCIARISEYGGTVKASYKQSVRICAVPAKGTAQAGRLLARLLPVKCVPIENYLTITLTPSNPILHTARLFALCKNHGEAAWAVPPLFYQDWDDAASELLLQCDEELQRLCGALSGIPLDVIPLRVHYEADTVQAMTRKLRSLPALKGIPCPVERVADGYALDLSSRYFVEDFPYGLCILKGFAAICGVPVPHMDLILRWYENIAGVQYFCGDSFCGPDLQKTGVPQNYGIHTIEDISHFYIGTKQ